MAAPSDSIAAILNLVRDRTGYASKDLTISRTITDCTEFTSHEQVIAADAVGVAVNFGPIASADFVLIYTPKTLGVHINDAAATEIQVGSVLLIMDSATTSINIDNDLEETPVDTTIEVWLGTTTT